MAPGPLISDFGPRTSLLRQGFAGQADLRPLTPDLVYKRSEPFNKAKALNAGIAAARGEWLAFTDDDTLPDEDWLRAGMRFAADGTYRVFGGRVAPGVPDQPLPAWLTPGRSGRTPQIGVFVGFDPLPASGRLPARAAAPFGANLFVRREVFAERGGYDEALWNLCRAQWPLGCEDSEFGHRLKLAGEPIGYCREALVVHPVNYERAGLRLHLRRAYGDGWRQPLIFAEERRPWLEPFRLKLAARWLAGAAADLCRRDPAGAADHLVECVRALGGVAGRWSRAYRERQTADRRPQTADRRLQTGDLRPRTTDHRLQTTDCRPETADRRLQTGDRRLETTDL